MKDEDKVVESFDQAMASLRHAGEFDRLQLMDRLGALGVSQTQRRIEREKTSPEGAAWKKTRDGRGALFATGSHLYDSIDHKSTAATATWGSGWIGARVHQLGATIVPVKARVLHFKVGGKSVFAKKVVIPARPYVGLSGANALEMERVAVRFLALDKGGAA